jgi:hypothetical protein
LLRGVVFKLARQELSDVKNLTLTAEVATKKGLEVNAVTSFHIE